MKEIQWILKIEHVCFFFRDQPIKFSDMHIIVTSSDREKFYLK